MPRKSKVRKLTTKSQRRAARQNVKTAFEPPRDWSRTNHRYFRAEIRRRQLPPLATTHQNQIKQLELSNPLSHRTPEGRRQAACLEQQKLALENAAHFPQFKKLPAELREYIWTLSFPGPRVLVVDLFDVRDASSGLFSRVNCARNPVALSTCVESRAVALRTYKLSFGTSNVYANLSGGDILYLTARRWPTINPALIALPWEDPSTSLTPGDISGATPSLKMNNAMKRDLEAVTNLAMSRSVWLSFTFRASDEDIRPGAELRQLLQKFKSLQRLSLISGYGYNTSHDQQVLRGGYEISDPWFQDPPVDIKNMANNPDITNSHRPAHVGIVRERELLQRLDEPALGLLCDFRNGDLTDDEKKCDFPEARLVVMKFVVDEPKRLREYVRSRVILSGSPA